MLFLQRGLNINDVLSILRLYVEPAIRLLSVMQKVNVDQASKL